LARQQRTDGSWQGDLHRTVAALLALLLLGHTRRSGSRRRVVRKAAKWLQDQSASTEASLALRVLTLAEQGEAPTPDNTWQPLVAAGAQGQLLRGLIAGR
jgi:hypothetical protein